jgi:hypothetical protein
MSGGPHSGIPTGETIREAVVDMVKDAVTGIWSPRQQEHGESINRANAVVRNQQRFDPHHGSNGFHP